MASYVDRSSIDEAIKVFKSYAEKTIEKSKLDSISNGKINGKKKKVNLLSIDDEDDKQMALAGFANDDKMFLQISFKCPPTNRSTFINNYRPLPHPYLNQIDATICLIVIDRNHKPLPDREYDLRVTKEYYQKRLRDAGISDDLIKHRLVILPMRELLTEYRLPQLKRRLAVSYDIFMADTRLIKNKFRTLPKFLGHKFWIDKKNFPIGVHLKYKGAILKESFDLALRTCPLYVTGHGPDVSMQFGVFKQSQKELADNLEFVCSNVYKTFGKAVQLLKIKSTRSMAIPFYADLNKPTAETKILIPRTSKLDSNPVTDDHPFCDNAELIVYPTGRTELKRPEGWVPGSDDEDEEDLYKTPYDDDDDDHEALKRKGFAMNSRGKRSFNSSIQRNSKINGKSKTDESKSKKLKV